MISDHAQRSRLAARSPAISHSPAAMGAVAKDALAVVLLLSVWTGTAGQISITVEKLRSKDNSCQLEIYCSKKMSFEKFQWYENDKLIADDDKRYSITYGGMRLTTTPSSSSTTYKCSLKKAPEEQMSIDVAPTCNFNPTILKTGRLGGCSVQLLAIKIACLCLWLAALGYTFYYCKRKTSQKATGKRIKVTEEGIYSHVGMSELGKEDNPPQEKEKAGPSQAKQTANPTYQSLPKSENDDYSRLATEGTPASAQDPTYQVLAKDKDDTYSTLQKPAADSETAVTTSATTEEVSLQGEAKT